MTEYQSREMRARYGDWIVRDVDGGLWVCIPQAFAETAT